MKTASLHFINKNKKPHFFFSLKINQGTRKVDFFFLLFLATNKENPHPSFSLQRNQTKKEGIRRRRRRNLRR
jgi:hypothetical protein